MKSVTLKEQLISYPEHLLDEWKNGNNTMLETSNASGYIKDILVTKAKMRRGTRFFGEAYVSSIMSDKMRNGWYTSYKWLITKKWISGNHLDDKFEKPFYEALHKYIGIDKLKKIQYQANLYYKKNKIKSQASDLWFIDKSNNHHFFEVKKGTDKIHNGQLEGLAILKKYLKASVSIVMLYPDNIKPPKTIDHTQRFSAIYNSI